MRTTLLILTLLLSACATPPPVSGRFAHQLSELDIREIKRVAGQFERKGHLARITARRPDAVLVEFVTYDDSGSIHTTFTVAKKGGTWVVDKKAPIQVRGHYVVDVA